MDGLQQQINELNHKVDRLHQLVEQLTQQITLLSSQAITSKIPVTEKKDDLLSSYNLVNEQAMPTANERFYSTMEHKDILNDDNEINSFIVTERESTLSNELQVRRLTAQLTAAYNRIAALEERLLSYRIHS